MINEYRSYAKHTRKIAAQLPLKHNITCLSIVNVNRRKLLTNLWDRELYAAVTNQINEI